MFFAFQGIAVVENALFLFSTLGVAFSGIFGEEHFLDDSVFLVFHHLVFALLLRGVKIKDSVDKSFVHRRINT